VTTVQQSFPVPPDALWSALPAGVTAIRGRPPSYDPQRGTVMCRTGMTLLSWGQIVHVTVSHAPGGSALTIVTTLKLGVFDWGEGKRLAHQFAYAVGQATGTAALA
jgi:hypothetical protein